MHDLKDHFIAALKKQPKYSEAHLQLALIYQEEGKNKHVIKHFELAILSDLEELDKFEKKGDDLMGKSQFQNAKNQFIKSNEKKLHCSKVYYLQAKFYIINKKYKFAKSSLEKCIDLNPDQSKAYRDLGIILFNEKKLDDARMNLEKSIDLDYSDSKSHFNLANIMIIMKDYNDAEQHFLSALDINPKFTECMINLALLKIEMKQFKEAKEYYIKAQKYSPKLINSTLEKKLQKIDNEHY